jgi:SAM-dependent methyltransferase
MINHKSLSYLLFLSLPVLSFGQKIKSNDSTFQLNEEPNVLLMETVNGLIPGKALDLGMELGRNSIYLAMNGWEVTGVDMADETPAPGLMEASNSKVSIAALETPMQSGDLGINEWNLIVHVYKGCFNDSRVSKISKALKPGGILVFEFFHREAGVEMKKPTFGCETNSIKSTIEQAGEFNILSYTEEVGLADYGLKNYKLVKLVAAKK